MKILEVIRAGGPIMIPLAVCSVVALAIILERALNLRSSRILDPALVERIRGLVEGGSPQLAIDVCREHPGLYTDIVLAGLRAAPDGEAAAKEAVEDAGRFETKQLTRYLVALGTVSAISPLLGLLGTVLGMIEVFKTIAEVGTGVATELSNGISQALITTAAGLLIAIPCLVAYNFFTEKADRIVHRLEAETLRVLRGLGSRRPQPAVAGE